MHTESAELAECSPAATQKIEPKDAFKFVLDTRNFEITNFWQRSNYFLVLNSGLAFGFFNLKETTYAPFVAVLGVIVSLLWYRVTLGSKFWQVHWEKKLKEIEEYYANSGALIPAIKLFCQDAQQVKDEVAKVLKAETSHGFLAKLVDREIVSKPSVTLAMISLSFTFILAWVLLLVTSMLKLLSL